MKNFTNLANQIALDTRSLALRGLILDALEGGKRGHLGPALSLLEIIRVLYDSILVHNPKCVAFQDRDRFILSKGHGCLGLYAVLSDHGYFSNQDMKDFCSFNSSLGGHPESITLPGVEFSTGSLGHGLSVGVGMAMAARIRNENWRTFVLLGDGELDEGSVWEAALHASHHRLSNLTIIIDYNGMQASGDLESVVTLAPINEKWRAFGFEVLEANGHDINQLQEILSSPRYGDRPLVVIAYTVKGKGIKSAENSNVWHHKAKISEDELNALRFDLLNQ